MKISQEWLVSYCDPGLTTAELEDRLTDSGTKVEAIHQHGPPSADGFVVGYVLSREQHPDADRLGVCMVDVGDAEPQQIVCGAANIDAGQYVPVARVGAVMPGGMKIKKAKLRGVESRGMICSASELELGAGSEGILVLGTAPDAGAEATGTLSGISPGKLVAGAPLSDVLPLGGPVIELEITPNRPDCLGVYEVARELHAATGAALNAPRWQGAALPEVAAGDAISASNDALSVTVADERCQRFTAVVYEDVRVRPSPPWLAARLVAAGQRPINNVVDITNYVMLETGQPLHAFDLDRIAGASLEVRAARLGEQVATLDGETREVPEDALLIADSDGPASVAGIIGGARSEVGPQTTRVVIEAATWHGPSIHSASWAMAVRTEASTRFEKSLPPEQVLDAQRRALQLMKELSGADPSGTMLDLRSDPPRPPVLHLPTVLCQRVLGYELSDERQIELLRAIDLGVESDGTGVLTVTIPPKRRNDLTRPIDLVEEIARLNGLGAIPATLPGGRPAGSLSSRQRADRAVLDLLVGRGLLEVVGWSFGNTTQFDKLGLPQDSELREAVVIRNPMSSELAQLRTTLLPSLLEIAQRNTAHGHRDLRLVELGATYRPRKGSLPDEQRTLGILLTGDLTVPTWREQQPPQADALAAAELLRAIGARLRIDFQIDQSDVPGPLHPGRGARVRLGDKNVGIIGELHPRVAAEYDLTAPVAVLELNVGALYDAMPGRVQYEPFGAYPPVSQDLAVVVDRTIPAADVVAAARGAGSALLRSADVFDVYEGAGVGPDQRSLALRLTFRADDRTLTEEDATAARQKILAALETKLGAVLRG